jgi:glycosyltransferase involved in cell wall biosynthesis
MHKIAFVVPTKDRKPDLRVMLGSLEKQTRLPDQIIVVDGSKIPVEHVTHEFPSIKIDYVRVFPPSLSAQRNAGMDKLNNEINLAGYLDDDLELESDAVEKMLYFWDNTSKEYGGATFAITNSSEPKGTSIKQYLGLDSVDRGKVLSTGWTSMLGNPTKNIEVEWLCGGATVWRKEIIESYKYDNWFQGTGFMEDVDFSYTVGEKYKLMLISDAKTAHHQHPIRPDRYFLLGKWQITNRLYFVRKHRLRGLSLTKAWLASISVLLLNSILSITRIDLNRARCALGNIMGIVITLTDKNQQIGGYLK